MACVDPIARGIAARALTEVSGLEVDSGIPAMSGETSDKFLSNDGVNPVWASLPDIDQTPPQFLITLTERGDGAVYTADKTYNQIKAAYDAGHPLVVVVDNGRLPMMNGEINGNGAGFTFGYTDVRANGELISTRAIHYLHTETDDLWADADMSAEYIQTTGGTITGRLFLANDPATEGEAATKAYVDDRHLGVIFMRDAVAGLNPDISTAEIQEAIVDGKTVIAILDNNEYPMVYYNNGSIVFGGISGSIATEIIYAEGAWTQTNTPILPIAGGTMTGDIDMGGNSVTNAQKIHVDGAAPLYLGSTIEPTGTTGTRLTGTTSGAAAFVKADKQSEYVPVYVGTPTENDHSANKKYVDDSAAAVRQYANGLFVYNADTKTLTIATA